MLPSYLPLRVADKILFVGKAMLLIRGQRPTTDTGAGRHRPPLRPSEDDYAALTPHLSQLPEAVRGRFDAGRVERIVDDTHQAVSQALWAVLNRETDVLATVQVRPRRSLRPPRGGERGLGPAQQPWALFLQGRW